MTEFGYLSEAAGKYGTLYVSQEFESFVEQVNDQQLRELTAAHDAIQRRSDAYRISRWIDGCFRDRQMISAHEFNLSKQVGQLLVLFNYLAEESIPSFLSKSVTYIKEHKRPDWKDLPDELSYLETVAERFGIYYSESDMLSFLENATEEEMDLLIRTSEIIRLNDHLKILNEWINLFPITECQESWLMYCLLGVLDHAELL